MSASEKRPEVDQFRCIPLKALKIDVIELGFQAIWLIPSHLGANWCKPALQFRDGILVLNLEFCV